MNEANELKERVHKCPHCQIRHGCCEWHKECIDNNLEKIGCGKMFGNIVNQYMCGTEYFVNSGKYKTEFYCPDCQAAKETYEEMLG